MRTGTLQTSRTQPSYDLVIWDSTADVFRSADLSVRQFLEKSPRMEGSNKIIAETCLAGLYSPNKQLAIGAYRFLLVASCSRMWTELRQDFPSTVGVFSRNPHPTGKHTSNRLTAQPSRYMCLSRPNAMDNEPLITAIRYQLTASVRYLIRVLSR